MTAVIALQRRLLYPVLIAAGAPSALKLPVLLVHETNDELVPMRMAHTLAAHIAGAIVVEDADSGHNDIFAARGFAECIARFSRGEICDALGSAK